MGLAAQDWAWRLRTGPSMLVQGAHPMWLAYSQHALLTVHPWGPAQHAVGCTGRHANFAGSCDTWEDLFPTRTLLSWPVPILSGKAMWIVCLQAQEEQRAAIP